jgi:capsular exopolysaccharide synthesis family protein
VPERDVPSPPPLSSRERRAEGGSIRPVDRTPPRGERGNSSPGVGLVTSWAQLQVTDHMPSLTDPFAPASEQYRMLRVRIDSLEIEGAGAPRVVALTSAFPGEGKTCTALNLAVVAAQDPDRRVAFIECDMRRPRVRGLLVGAAPFGLAEVLGGRAPLAEALTRLDEPGNLTLLLAGQPPGKPVELLASEAMGTVFKWLREHADLVIVDAPPALHFADASQLAAHVDGFLLVARSGRTPREALLKTWRLLSPHRVLGIVLNDVDPGPGSGYGYYRYPQRGGAPEGGGR